MMKKIKGCEKKMEKKYMKIFALLIVAIMSLMIIATAGVSAQTPTVGSSVTRTGTGQWVKRWVKYYTSWWDELWMDPGYIDAGGFYDYTESGRIWRVGPPKQGEFPLAGPMGPKPI